MPLITHARSLRRNQTDAERALWQHLRGKRLQGLKFRRQHPHGRYILDFVCLEARLVIELDGGQHQDSPADRERDAWLQARGFQILRFWNHDVLARPVLERLFAVLSPA
ncbi:DNA (cytosine-5-)-methyltransferase [Pseudomonas oryzihabitans]|nr:DNA (cytosine-5-)-methyltransferase [Pseudomonas psychrotolerans]KTT04368.1 DNA (cytosine-5-)-methyltransferase [Pseudomonas psychrotolerans]KTT41101.1 DNA (cytosine-5-)-methyltransferase [Pseudomonas psychrotolerans]KTT46095.1 DNA (cytosine-5-)-methyltransferase [Pseudomonas psychrotolerans]KTT64459.1 DNA (cytosine-5-)-methyltransferase [Pseudomonas psychrotolerans]